MLTTLKSCSVARGALPIAILAVACGPVAAQGLFGYDGLDNDLYAVTSAPSATFIGNDSDSGIPAEIEFGGGFIWLADTGTNTNLHRMDPATGQVLDTLTLTFPANGDVLTSLEFVGGTLYAGLTTEGGGETYLSTVDLGTGVVTSIGATGMGNPFGGLAYRGTTMFGVTAGGSVAQLVTLDLATGAATPIGTITIGGTATGVTALEFGTDGVLYALPNANQDIAGHLLTVDPVTAAAVDLGDLGIRGMNALTAVPEPGTLIALGLGSLLALRRRRS